MSWCPPEYQFDYQSSYLIVRKTMNDDTSRDKLRNLNYQDIKIFAQGPDGVFLEIQYSDVSENTQTKARAFHLSRVAACHEHGLTLCPRSLLCARQDTPCNSVPSPTVFLCSGLFVGKTEDPPGEVARAEMTDESNVDALTRFVEVLATIGSFLLVLVTLPFSLCFTFKVVQEYERAVVFRMGRLKSGAYGPGADMSKRGEYNDLKITEAYFRRDGTREKYDIRKIRGSFNLLMKPEHSASKAMTTVTEMIIKVQSVIEVNCKILRLGFENDDEFNCEKKLEFLPFSGKTEKNILAFFLTRYTKLHALKTKPNDFFCYEGASVQIINNFPRSENTCKTTYPQAFKRFDELLQGGPK
ncbi:hypothetical protein WN51_05022 [Melipona quadrifasciata]|uniref:Uncharacterized protein n=1 Tax=Melipona quadrifasciata TaxID=166423 RepID=A0A0M8ZRZ0_9HYME|nr:hypothetical protein WN51_05022 [Melipona quadrifasciata]